MHNFVPNKNVIKYIIIIKNQFTSLQNTSSDMIKEIQKLVFKDEENVIHRD